MLDSVLSFAKRIQDGVREIGGTMALEEAIIMARRIRQNTLIKAQDILLRAERERLEIADAEAGRGIQYNEDGGLFV